MAEQGELVADRRQFLGWDEPAVTKLVHALTAADDDLGSLLLVVPTSESGRRLSRALQASGVRKCPEWVTPVHFFMGGGGGRISETIGWQQVARETDWSRYAELLPDPVAPPPESVRGLLAHVRTMRAELAEHGLDLRRASRRLGNAHPEYQRWAALADLEETYRATMLRLGLADVQDEKSQAARSFQLPRDKSELVIACVPDPVPLAVHVWERLALTVPVRVFIHAPNEEAAHFDDWGRPLTQHWMEREVPLKDTDQISICEQPADQASVAVRQIAENFSEKGEVPMDELALAVCDRAILPEMTRVFSDHDWSLFDPAGRTLSETGLLQWLSDLGEWIVTEDVRLLSKLIPQFWTNKLTEEKAFLATSRLSEIIELYLPQTTKDVSRRIREGESDKALEVCLELLDKTRDQFLNDGVAETLRHLLAALLDGEETLLESCETVLEEIGTLERKVELGPRQWIDSFVSSASSIRLPVERTEGQLESQGWLELSYHSAPFVIVSGFNEGSVPESQQGDAWLSNTMRTALSLKANRSRIARDAFLTTSLIESRKQDGRVQFIAGRWNATGESILPSRLLMRCASNDLAERVLHCFCPQSSKRLVIPWTRDWKLSPLAQQVECERFSATSLGTYLSCPFRYYLSHVLKMQRPELLRNEWSARAFGNVLHKVLERFGRDEEAKMLTRHEAISTWLSNCLDQELSRWFRSEAPMAIEFQTESARQRLDYFARRQAVRRSEGWAISDVELKVELDLDGVVVSGVIDRIDQNLETGEWMIWDYKTGKSALDVASAHCKAVSSRSPLPRHLSDDAFTFEGPGATKSKATSVYYWRQLQLPLYAAWLRREKGVQAGVGYISLRPTAKEVDFQTWDWFDQSAVDAGETAAREIIARIKRGVFWPPAEKVDFDAFKDMADGRDLKEAFEAVLEK